MAIKGVVAAGLISLLSALGLPFLTQGAFIHRALIILILLISCFTLVIGITAYLLALFKGPGRVRPKMKRLIAYSVFGLLQWTAIPVFDYIDSEQLAQAQGYCNTVLPRLEHYRSEHHRYPDTLTLVSSVEEVPAVLRNQDFYWSRTTPDAAEGEEAHRFGFRFRLPGSPPLFSYRYDSLTRQWSSGD